MTPLGSSNAVHHAVSVQDGEGSTNRLLLLGVVWRDHVPHLRMRRDQEKVSVLVPLATERLNYRIEGEPQRTCLGHFPFRKGGGDYYDCGKTPRPGSRLCERCSIVEATFASNLHHAHTRGSSELDPAIQKHLAQPNRLYLAAFRDGSIKIGTSTLARADKRLEEQGAWIARFAAETSNGKIVRHLEDAVTEQLGLPQAVSAARKRRGLISPVDDTRLAAELDEFATSVLEHVISQERDESVTPLDLSWRHPMADHPAAVEPIDYPLRLQRGRHDLELITAIGRHLLVRKPAGRDVFVIDPAPLFGVWLDIGNYGSDEFAIQDSLF